MTAPGYTLERGRWWVLEYVVVRDARGRVVASATGTREWTDRALVEFRATLGTIEERATA